MLENHGGFLLYVSESEETSRLDCSAVYRVVFTLMGKHVQHRRPDQMHTEHCAANLRRSKQRQLSPRKAISQCNQTVRAAVKGVRV